MKGKAATHDTMYFCGEIFKLGSYALNIPHCSNAPLVANVVRCVCTII
jgi:hypothetical protein